MVGSGSAGGGKIPFAGVDAKLVTIFCGGDVDGPVLAIALEESGLISNEIAAAEHLLNVLKTALETVDRAWRKGGSAGKIGKSLQRVLAHQRLYGGGLYGWIRKGFPGADGVDGNFAMLGAGNRLFQSDTAGVVFTVADDHEHPG